MTDVADTFAHANALAQLCVSTVAMYEPWTPCLGTISFFIALYQGRGWPAKWCCWLSSRRDHGDLTSGWPEIFEEAIQSPFYSVTTQWVSPIRDQLQPLLSHRWKACSKNACTVCTWPTCMYSQVDPWKGMNMQRPTTPQRYRTHYTLCAHHRGKHRVVCCICSSGPSEPNASWKTFFFFFKFATEGSQFAKISRLISHQPSILNCFQP